MGLGQIISGVSCRAGLGHVLDWFYPGVCTCCGELCAGERPICLECLAQLGGLESAAACRWCGNPLSLEGAPCPWCRGRGLYPYDLVLRLGIFAEPLRELIHQTKYGGRWPLGEFLADRLLVQERVKGLLSETDCLVPVPLHWVRQFVRRYNQAEVIARRLAKRCGLRLVRPVRRVRNTESQTRLSRTQREANLRGAFAMRGRGRRGIEGKHVVVVDDVMTTGATLQAVGRALLAAKPASLCAIVVAVADPRGQGFQAI